MIEEKLNVSKILNTNIFYKHTYHNELLDTVTRKVTNKEPNYLLIIAGCSGSGKSYFEKCLVEYYPKYFSKLPQITTRSRRGKSDNGYYFVNKEIYDYMHDSLIARLDNFGENQYGTIPVFEKGKINTVIASYDAIDDLFELINDEKLFIIPMMILFDITDENITKEGKRINRDKEFLEKERKELYNVFEKYKNECIYSTIYRYEDYGKFVEIPDIITFAD